jgi:hypothetical protein
VFDSLHGSLAYVVGVRDEPGAPSDGPLTGRSSRDTALAVMREAGSSAMLQSRCLKQSAGHSCSYDILDRLPVRPKLEERIVSEA